MKKMIFCFLLVVLLISACVNVDRQKTEFKFLDNHSKIIVETVDEENEYSVGDTLYLYFSYVDSPQWRIFNGEIISDTLGVGSNFRERKIRRAILVRKIKDLPEN